MIKDSFRREWYYEQDERETIMNIYGEINEYILRTERDRGRIIDTKNDTKG